MTVKKSFIIYSFFLFACADIGKDYIWNENNQLMFYRNFGTIGYDYGWGGSYSPYDNGAIIIGSQQKLIDGQRDIWAIKTDDRGMLVWDKTFGGTSNEEGYDIISTSDGGFLFVGYSWSFGNEQQAYVVKTDFHGNTEWERNYGGIMWEVLNAVIEIKGGGYVAVGYTNSPGISSGNTDIMLLRLSENGDQVWLKAYGNESFPNHEWGNDLIQVDNEGFIIVGSRDRYNNGSKNELLLRVDNNGDKIWEKEILTTDQTSEIAYSITQSSNGGYFVCSGTNSILNKQIYSPKIIKIDGSGNIEWSRVYTSNSVEAHQFRANSLANGDIMIVGTTNKNSPFGNKDEAFLIRIDSKGSIKWTQSYGTSEEDDWGWFVFEKNVGDIVMIGSTKSFNSSLFDIFMIGLSLEEDKN